MLKPERASLRDDLAAVLWPFDPEIGLTTFGRKQLDAIEAVIEAHSP